MLDKDMTKKEIDDILRGKGDFVRIDHLERFLRQNPPIEKRKYAFVKLSEIYEQKGMFSDAARAINGAAIASLTFKEKIRFYVKEAELLIKAGRLERSDEAIKMALAQANASERVEIMFVIKEFYNKQAESYEIQNRRNHSIKLYEKLLTMKISDIEREEIKKELLRLYEKTGRLKEFFKLKGRE